MMVIHLYSQMGFKTNSFHVWWWGTTLANYGNTEIVAEKLEIWQILDHRENQSSFISWKNGLYFEDT